MFLQLTQFLPSRNGLRILHPRKPFAVGEAIINKEIKEAMARAPSDFSPAIIEKLLEYRLRIKNGERDLCF